MTKKKLRIKRIKAYAFQRSDRRGIEAVQCDDVYGYIPCTIIIKVSDYKKVIGKD